MGVLSFCKVAHVDLLKELNELGLARSFPPSVWPHAPAVRKLATKIKTLANYGQVVALINVDLREYLPAACADYLPVWLNEDGVPAGKPAAATKRHD